MTTTHMIPSEADLAEVLFASTLQESDAPTAAQVRAVIEQGLSAWMEDCTECLARVAQEAGDHPDEFRRRMHWALATVHSVYGARLT
jgi:hypothetical protein